MAFTKKVAPTKTVATKTVATKSTKPAAKAKVAIKPLTPLQKKNLKLFKAPADFKSTFLVVKIKAAKDGVVDSVDAQVIQGRLDNERSLKASLAAYDINSYTRLVARLSAPYWAANPQKRLPANGMAKLTLRVGKRSTGALTARIVEIATITKNETTGKLVSKVLEDKKNPTYRLYRKVAATLSGFAVGLNPLTKQVVNSLCADEVEESPATKKPVAKKAPVKVAAKKPAAKKPVRR